MKGLAKLQKGRKSGAKAKKRGHEAPNGKAQPNGIKKKKECCEYQSERKVGEQ